MEADDQNTVKYIILKKKEAELLRRILEKDVEEEKESSGEYTEKVNILAKFVVLLKNW